MAASDQQERTEQATPKRREDARKKGQVARSREVPSVLILLGALSVFFFGGSWMLGQTAGAMERIFENLGTFRLQQASLPDFLAGVFETIFRILFPLLTAVVVAGLAANVLQVGFRMSPEALRPKLSKLDPLKGVRRLLSLQSLAEVVKSVLKIAVVGGVAFHLVRGELDRIPSLMRCPVADSLAFAGDAAIKIGFYTCLVLLLLALLDFAFQRWQHEKQLRMTKQEVKEEHKQREGDPQVKARIRRTQAEMARHRMMEAVPDADVVLTNPTRLAIALRFDAARMAAPCVVAKGAGFVADRIRSLAKEHNVPIVENKPLARTLFQSVDIGGAIPAELYRAVAEVLAYVYRVRGRRPGPR
jgi:flagellar biosynthetic protein FlhB